MWNQLFDQFCDRDRKWYHKSSVRWLVFYEWYDAFISNSTPLTLLHHKWWNLLVSSESIKFGHFIIQRLSEINFIHRNNWYIRKGLMILEKTFLCCFVRGIDTKVNIMWPILCCKLLLLFAHSIRYCLCHMSIVVAKMDLCSYFDLYIF